MSVPHRRAHRDNGVGPCRAPTSFACAGLWLVAAVVQALAGHGYLAGACLAAAAGWHLAGTCESRLWQMREADQ